MRIVIRQSAPEGTRFASGAFDSQIGKGLPLTLGGEQLAVAADAPIDDVWRVRRQPAVSQAMFRGSGPGHRG